MMKLDKQTTLMKKRLSFDRNANRSNMFKRQCWKRIFKFPIIIWYGERFSTHMFENELSILAQFKKTWGTRGIA